MQTRADAEIVVYSGKIKKPGDQRCEAQYDRQAVSQECTKSKTKIIKTRNKQGQGKNRSRIQRGVVYNITDTGLQEIE